MFKERNNMDEIVQIFKEKNLKLTLQRINIYSYLRSTCEHPSVDTIYKHIKQIIPSISLATVYKTLNTLVDAGLVRVLNVCEENFRYDSNINTHGHVKCTECNKVEDIILNDTLLNSLTAENYKINNFDLILYGKCKSCLSK